MPRTRRSMRPRSDRATALIGVTSLVGCFLIAAAALAAPGPEAGLSQRSADLVVTWMQERTDGEVGVFLQRAGGPVLGAFHEEMQFEPASAIKALHHLHALRQVDAGAVHLYDPIVVFEALDGSCPHDDPPLRVEPLRQVLRLMMERSSNSRTRAVQKLFGESALNATAAEIGMEHTEVRHPIGCGGRASKNPNRTTLVDLAALYEGALDGDQLTAASRTQFIELMSEGRLFVNSVINQEATALGISADTRDQFKSGVRTVWKGGTYAYGSPSRKYRSFAGWISLPVASPAPSRDYVFGVFVDKATTFNLAGTGNLSVKSASASLLRDVIRHALEDF